MLGAFTAYLRLFFARNLGAYYAFGWGMGRGVCFWGSQQHDASHKTKVGRIGHKHFGMGCSASLRARLGSHLRRSGLFLQWFPGLPAWANLFRAYGAGPMWRGELSRR